MRMLDHEQLVRPLQQFVHGRTHRSLHDLDEVLGVELLLGSDVERPAPALVVRRKRNELEDPLDIELVEPGVQQPFTRLVADEPLRARARVDPGRLDADHTAHALLGRGPHLGAERALALGNVPRDVVGERFDEQRLTDHDLLDRFLEQLREAGHVDTLLRRA